MLKLGVHKFQNTDSGINTEQPALILVMRLRVNAATVQYARICTITQSCIH